MRLQRACVNFNTLAARDSVDKAIVTLLLLFVSAASAVSQQPPSDPPLKPGTLKSAQNEDSTAESRRIFGIIPNYRTSPTLANYEPLSIKRKFKLAGEDAFDRGTVVLAALFAGEGQLTNSNRAFGQGAAGYGRYFATSYSDFVIGDYMTEAIFPSVLHQDPRYFRDGKGSGWSRLGYACGQIFWTHKDSGGTQFNFSEIAGNSVAVAIGNSYYVDNRTWQDATVKLAGQLGVDMAANILKEFWPEIQHRFTRKRAAGVDE